MMKNRMTKAKFVRFTRRLRKRLRTMLKPQTKPPALGPAEKRPEAPTMVLGPLTKGDVRFRGANRRQRNWIKGWRAARD